MTLLKFDYLINSRVPICPFYTIKKNMLEIEMMMYLFIYLSK